jgi:hypothetical protein
MSIVDSGSLCPSAHKFNEEFIGSGLGVEQAFFAIWRIKNRHRNCASKH